MEPVSWDFDEEPLNLFVVDDCPKAECDQIPTTKRRIPTGSSFFAYLYPGRVEASLPLVLLGALQPAAE